MSAHVQPQAATVQPSNTAIVTPAQRWASQRLDQLELERENANGQLRPFKRLMKRGIEAAFVPVIRCEARHD